MAPAADTARDGAKSIAVFDVGKTNKKLLVFNHRLDLVDEAYHTFDQYEKDGVQIEAVEETSAWLIASLKAMALKHDIGAVSVSTHGAAFACVDAAGRLAMPVLSYTTDPGPDFVSRFSAEYGDPITLQKDTKTPDMIALGCMAKGIAFARERWPQQFKKTAAILPLPQYYGFVLTGNKAIDPTNVGCHTAFWNFEKADWSPIVDRMGLSALFPETISDPWAVLGTLKPDIARETGLSEDTVVTVGIHDSNASLLPYLIKQTEPFVVNSTGTVSVSLRPTADVALRDEDLGKIVYYNLSAFKTPVKTTIFMGGMEFDTYMGLLSTIHGQAKHPPLDKRLMEDILDRRKLFVLPSFIPFGMFPGSAARVVQGDTVIPLGELFGGKHPSFFGDFATAYHVLVLSVALQAEVALRAVGLSDGMRLFIEGGFAKNEVYTRLLAALFLNSPTATTNLAEATAFGAALLGKAALMGTTPRELSDLFEIEAREVAPERFEGLEGYREQFLKLVEGR
ncbi:MAG: carbohydrate kinase [Deltaproteobacteria bacterium]|nr:carbohydrate kinase [Candidatus Zymogenaceae bacterium]